MKTIDYIKKYNGNIIVAKLAENLTLAGTYHGLNENDKKLLEELVYKSEFIASERWGNPDIIYVPISKRFRVDKAKQVYCNWPDGLYIDRIVIWTTNKEKKGVQAITTRMGVKRDWTQNEFDYVKNLARAKGKEFYIADMTDPEFLEYFFRERKGNGFIASIRTSKDFFEKAIKEADPAREATMLQRIIEHEGQPISQLKRPGLLIVGATHAVNYLEGKHDELLK